MMRVVVFHPHLDVKGGSEHIAKNFSDGMRELGNEVLTVTFDADRDWFPKFTKISKPEELKDIVKDFSPDLVFLAISETRYAEIVEGLSKIAMYVHFPVEEEVDEENIKEYMKKGRFLSVSPEELNLIDVIFTNSKRSALTIKLVWDRDSYVIHPPLEPRYFEGGSKRKPPKNKILCTGRFTPLKRQDFLILALEKIRKKISDAELILAGFQDLRHKDYFNHVRKIAKEVGKVRIFESPSDDELFKLYDEAKVYAHPRIGEHFGISPCEAMSRGVPVVMRAPTGLQDITEKFIAKSDWEFVEIISEILSIKGENWLKLGDEFRQKVKGLTRQNFTKKILEALSGLK